MLSYDLKGRSALVTGAASGIGFATASLLARSGAIVAVNFLPSDPRGPEAVARLASSGGKAIAAPGDVGNSKDAESMVKTAIDQLGRLDLLVNNAGTPATKKVIEPKELELITEELWSIIVNTNLKSVFYCTRAAAPALKKTHGAVVSIASIAGINSTGSSIPYGATKAGVINMTKNLARALAPEVRVNAIAPGAVDSAWMIEWTEEQRRQSIAKALLNRRATPDDMAEVIVFFGMAASMVTGHTVVVDGGLSL